MADGILWQLPDSRYAKRRVFIKETSKTGKFLNKKPKNFSAAT